MGATTALLALLASAAVAQGRPPLPPVKLGFQSQPPQTVQGGSRINPSIRVALLDSTNTPVTTANDSVTLAILKSNAEGGALSGRLTVAAKGGVATFDSISLNKLGTYTLIATTQALGVASADSRAVTVVVGSAARLAFISAPTNIGKAGFFLKFLRVAVQDSGGNFVGQLAGWPITVALGSSSAPTTLSGTLKLDLAKSVADFKDLKFATPAEGVTLVASTIIPGIIPATSAPFAVRDPGPPARVRIDGQKRYQAGNPPLKDAIVVSVHDSSGIWLPKGGPAGQPVLTLIDGPQQVLRPSAPVFDKSRGFWVFSPAFSRPGSYRLVATYPSLIADTSSSITVDVGAPKKLEIMLQPQPTGVDQPITPAVQVRVVDASRTLVASASDTITVSLHPRPGLTGAIGGTTVVEANNGIATFDNIKISAPGEGYKLLFFSKRAIEKDTSAGFSVGAVGTVAKLRIVAVPPNVTAGAVIAPSIKVVGTDSSGNVVRSFAEPVTLSLTGGPPGASMKGTLEVDPVDGVAVFNNVKIDSVGTAYRIVAKAADVAADTSQNQIDVTTGPAAGLKFRTQPQKFEYGQEMPGTIQVDVVDAGGNPVRGATDSLVLSVNPFYPISGNFVARAVGGVATFSNLRVDGLPNGREATLVVASAAQPGLTRGVSAPFTSSPGKAAKLVVTQVPALMNQGQGSQRDVVKVEVRDANNNLALDNSEITLSLGANPGRATLGGTVKRKAVNGVATFSELVLTRLGRGYTFVASAGALEAGTSQPFDVAGKMYQIAFKTPPLDGVRNAPLPVVVQVQDSLGTPVNAGAVKITFSLGVSPNPKATVEGTVEVMAQSSQPGVATAPTEAKVADLRISEDGQGFRLLASGPTLASAESEPFTMLRYGSPRKLAFDGPVPVSNPGKPITPDVKLVVLDSAGNVVENSTDNIMVTLESNAAGATASAPTLSATAAAGRATLAGLAISGVGTGFVLRATSGTLEAATSAPFAVVDAGAPCKLAFTSQPQKTTAGAAIAPALTVAVQSCDGTVVATATPEITLEVGAGAPEGSRLEGSTGTPAAAGTASFSDLQIKRAFDGYTLVARASGLTPAQSAPFSVVAGAAAKLIVLNQPENAVAGENLKGQVRVMIADVHNNRVTSAPNQISIGTTCSFKSTSTTAGSPIKSWQGSFTLPSGTCTSAKGAPVGAIRGEAVFDLSKFQVRGAAADIKYVFTSPSLEQAESPSFRISPSVPYALGFEGIATSEPRRAKIPFEPIKVTIRDSIGNDVGQGTDLIQLGLSGKAGTLTGAKEQQAESGVAQFKNLSVSEGGDGIALVASATGLLTGTSSAFSVARFGKPVRLYFREFATVSAPDQRFVVRVEIHDDVANVVDTARAEIKLSIENNAGDGTAELRGEGPSDTKAGVAEFRDVRIRQPGEGYTLRATGGGLQDAVSVPFTIGVPPQAAPPPPKKPPTS